MRQVVGHDEGKKTTKNKKLMRKREAGWEMHVDFGLRPGESDGVGKESALARWSGWTDCQSASLAERVGD